MIKASLIFNFLLIKKFNFKILILIILFTKNLFAYNSQLFEPKIPNEFGLNIKWESLKEYNDLLYQAIVKDGFKTPIDQKYKKNISGKLYIQNKLNNFDIHSVRIRITGDWKDHIDYKKGISSFKINMRDGNIGGITKFRLLLPKSRNFEGEIFWSVLMETLGFPTLYKKIVTINLNGLIEQNYLFEETPAKEFLERFKIRESPIIELDEREGWYLKLLQMKCEVKFYEYCKSDYLSKNIEDLWKIDNKNFIKDPISLKIAYDALYSVNNIFEINNKRNPGRSNLIDKFEELNILYAEHGLRLHNRKFIYDPIYQTLIPTYFDGDINLLQRKCNTKTKYNSELNDIELNKKIKTVSEKYYLRANKKITPLMLCVAKQILKNNNLYLRKKDLINIKNTKFYPILKKNSKYADFYINNQFDGSTLCLDNICKTKNFKDTKKLISADFDPYVSGFKKKYAKINFDKKINKIKIINSYKNVENIYIKSNEVKYLKTKNNLKKLNIKLESSQYSKLVIFDSKLIDTEIRVSINNSLKNKYLNSIKNTDYLTGCITIIDSTVENIKFNADNLNCEDSINFIRTNGTVREINIKNSYSDAVDADFSQLSFKNIEIETSKNDCLDLSGGDYIIDKLLAFDCGDKGISVGEKSKVELISMIASNNIIDFVSKDSSVLNISDFQSDKTNNDICGSAYKKKQEFSGGSIILMNKIDCKVIKDEHSIIKQINK